MTSKKNRRRGIIVALTSIIALALLTPIRAENNGKREAGLGQYAELTALWWEWVYAHPAMDVGVTNTFPILDTTGQFATVGQENGIGPNDKFFFLCGTFGGTVTRQVTVRPDKILFFPIFNIETDNAVDPPTTYGVPQLRANAAASIESATSASATVDGKAVEVARIKSPVFDYVLPDDDSIYDYFGLVGPQFEGRIKPAVSDGLWSAVGPLTPGPHVVRIQAAAPGFSLDVTYELWVEDD